MIIVLSVRAASLSRSLARARRDCHESEEKLGELSELGRKQEEQLEHSTRLAELGEMAASISHELNQPLTGIRNYARNAFYMIEKKAGSEEEVKGNLRLISEQVDRAARIINQMRELTRRSDTTFSILEINGVLRECMEFLVPQMKLSEVGALPFPGARPASGLGRQDPACPGLPQPAHQRPPGHGRRGRQAPQRHKPARRNTRAARGDRDPRHGQGLHEEQARRLFQPFYTTRKGGHGLGLSISRAIIKDHKGDDRGRRGRPGRVQRSRIRLPAAPGAGPPIGEAETDGRARQTQRRDLIVVIDDDEAARHSIGQMLRLRGWPSEVFSSAEAALAWPGLRGGDVHHHGREDAGNGRGGVPRARSRPWPRRRRW